MGFDKYSTIFTFFLGTINSLKLIDSNNSSNKLQNLVTGKVFMVLFGLKLFEFFIWLDKDCISGINEMANIMGSLFDNLVPTFIYALFTIKNKRFDNTLTYVNAAYIFYVIYNFISFVKMMKYNSFCTWIFIINK